MAGQILDGTDIDASFEEMGGKGMAKRVAGGRFGKAGLARRILNLQKQAAKLGLQLVPTA